MKKRHKNQKDGTEVESGGRLYGGEEERKRRRRRRRRRKEKAAAAVLSGEGEGLNPFSKKKSLGRIPCMVW